MVQLFPELLKYSRQVFFPQTYSLAPNGTVLSQIEVKYVATKRQFTDT